MVIERARAVVEARRDAAHVILDGGEAVGVGLQQKPVLRPDLSVNVFFRQHPPQKTKNAGWVNFGDGLC